MPDVEADGDPEAVARFKQAIDEVDALLMATPEYNHCVSMTLVFEVQTGRMREVAQRPAPPARSTRPSS
jgi:hypothetical protein